MTSRTGSISFLGNPIDRVPAHKRVAMGLSQVPEGRRIFAQMKQGARLINTARGELVDNASLVKALESGHLAGAGIDTLAPEPVTPDNPLLHLSQEASERVLFSPHIAGITNGSMRRMQQHMWQNVRLLGEDKRPTCVVNGI